MCEKTKAKNLEKRKSTRNIDKKKEENMGTRSQRDKLSRRIRDQEKKET